MPGHVTSAANVKRLCKTPNKDGNVAFPAGSGTREARCG